MKIRKIMRGFFAFLVLVLASCTLVACDGGGDPPSQGGDTKMSFFSELSPYTVYLEWESEDGLFEELPEPPVEAGYTFIHWSLGGSNEAVTLEELNFLLSEGGGGAQIYAKYLPNTDTPYKVNYYLEEVDSDDYTLEESVTLTGTSDSVPVIPGKDFGIYIKREDHNLYSIDRHGTSEIDVYYDLPRYNVVFSLENVSRFDGLYEQRVKHGADVKVPTVKRFGYRFLGFDKELTNITESITVTSLWEVIDYTISYEAGIGTLPTGLPETYNAEGDDISFATLPKPIPPSDDYRFVGWKNEAGVTVSVLPSTADRNVLLTAEYEYMLDIENGIVKGVTDYGETKTTIIIPSEYDGVPVTEIASFAFGWLPENVTRVVLPASIRTLRESAFYGSDGIEELVIPETVELIEDGAIYSCLGLVRLTLPYLGESRDATEDLYFSRALGGTSAGFNASSLVSEKLRYVTVSGGALAEDSFKGLSRITSLTLSGITGGFSGKSLEGCTSLSELSISAPGYSYSGGVLTKDGKVIMSTTANLPSDVTGIASYAFMPVSETALASAEIERLTVPSSVTTLENACLFGLDSLTELTLPFLGDVSLYSASSEVRAGRLAWLFTYDDGIGQLSVPDSLDAVTVEGGAIFKCAFDSSKVSTVYIGSGVTDIAMYAFSERVGENDHLINVNFDSETAISALPEAAFYACSALLFFHMPSSVEAIGARVFYGCSSLYAIVLSDEITVIPDYAFYDCSSLSLASLPSGTTEIGKGAFGGCESLSMSGFPPGVSAIADYAFYGCSSFGAVTLHEGISSVGEGAFSLSGVTSLTFLADNVTIGESAFSGCTSLVTVNWGGVTDIAQHAFYGCSSLTTATLPESVVSIGSLAFYGCISIESATVPASVRSIGSGVFGDCIGLVRLNLFPGYNGVGKLPELVSEDFVEGCTSLTELYVGEGSTCGGTSNTSISLNSSAFKHATLEKLHIGGGVFYISASDFKFTSSASVTFETPANLTASASGTSDRNLPTLAGSTSASVISRYFIENLGIYWYCENP